MTTEAAKKLAAYRAVDEQVLPKLTPGAYVGIGSGSTVVYAVDRLIEKVSNDPNLFGKINCVPSSYQAKGLILGSKGALVLTDMERLESNIKIGIDGADEVDNDFNLIKGGGGCLTQEKIVASVCDNFVIVADDRKNSQKLGEKWTKGLPIEVIPLAMNVVKRSIENQFSGTAVLRMAKAKAGPLGDISLKIQYELL